MTNIFSDPLSDGVMPDPITDGSLPDPLGGAFPQGGGGTFNIFDRQEPTNSPNIFETKNPFIAGKDMGDALLYSGGKSFAQMFGNKDLEEFFAEGAKTNLEDASTNLDSFIEKVVFAAGTASVPIATVLAGAAAAPLIGGSAAVGGTIAGVLSGLGLNAGDIQLKAEELDPDYQAGAQHALASAITTLPDLVAIGKFKQIVSPLQEGVQNTIRNRALADITGLKNATGTVLKETAKTAPKIGLAEGIQDAATSGASLYLTDTSVDESRVKSIASAALEEGLIGTVLGVPIGGFAGVSTHTKQVREAWSQEYLDNMEKDAVQRLDEGVWDEPVDVNLAPVGGAASQPGFFNIWYNTLTGNASGVQRAKYGSNPYINRLLNAFNLPVDQRSAGQFTATEWARGEEAQAVTIAQPFLDLDAASQDAVWEARASGDISALSETQTKGYDALHTLLSEHFWRLADRVSKGEIDVMEGGWADPHYLPTYLALDQEVMYSDMESTLKKAEENLIAQGKEDKVEGVLGILKKRAAAWQSYGNELHYGMSKNSKLESVLVDVASGERTLKKGNLRKLLKGMSKQRQQDLKQSPLTLDRELQELSQDFFTEFYQKKYKKGDILRQHIRQMTEHMAIVDNFGQDLRHFDNMLAKAIAWGQANGKEIQGGDVVKFYDILRTQQRIPLREMRPGMRKALNRIRASVNISLLGLSFLVSIPEAAVVVMNSGVKDSLKGAIRSVRGGKEGQVSSKELGLGLDHSMNSALARTGEDYFNIGRLEDLFFRRVAFLPQVHNFLSRWAAHTADAHLKGLVQKYHATDNVTERVRILDKVDEAGLNFEELSNWVRSGASTDTTFFKDTYTKSLLRLVADTIVDPHPIDKPTWMSDPNFMLISQLKSFMVAFTNRVLGGMKGRAERGPMPMTQLMTTAVPFVVMYLGGQIAVQYLRSYLAGGEEGFDKMTDKHIGEVAWNSLAYLGSLSIFVDFVNALRYNSDPLSGQVPAAGIGLNLIKGGVRSIEAMDPDYVVEEIVKTTVPNWYGSSAVEEVILEGIGVGSE